jgi:hypothetical protein
MPFNFVYHKGFVKVHEAIAITKNRKYSLGFTTFSIMVFSIWESIVTLSIMDLIVILSIKGTQHNALGINIKCHYA